MQHALGLLHSHNIQYVSGQMFKAFHKYFHKYKSLRVLTFECEEFKTWAPNPGDQPTCRVQTQPWSNSPFWNDQVLLKVCLIRVGA